MGNEIYLFQNKEEFSSLTKKRINTFISIFNTYKKNGITADVACGNKYIGEKVEAKYFYDYYCKDQTVRFCNLNSFKNNVLEKVDNIILSHAIEHFSSPKLVLDILFTEFLKNLGRLFIACPNPEFDNKFKPYSLTIGHVSQITSQKIKSYTKKVNFRLLFSAENNLYKGYEELFFVLEKRVKK